MLLKKYTIESGFIFVRTKLNWKNATDFCREVVNCIYVDTCVQKRIKNSRSMSTACIRIGMDNDEENKFTYIPHQMKYAEKEI